MEIEIFGAPALEFKFEGSGLGPGEFSGYGSVFGNQDSHGDVISPGAFAESLAERKAQGRNLPMHVMHGIFGGDGLPVGVWKSVDEDEKGLRVHGKISGMSTDAGKLNFERLRDGAFGGLSIGYSVNPNGSVKGEKPRDPKRLLKSIKLHEISLVDEPSNALARIDEMKAYRRMFEAKAILSTPATEKAAQSIVAALALHRETMAGNDSPTAEERDQFLAHLQDAHEHLTGARMPAGMKSAPHTLREFERTLREIGLSNKQARAFAEAGFKTIPRDEAIDPMASSETKAALVDIGASLADFTLPSF